MADCVETVAALIITGAMDKDEFEERSVIYGTDFKMRVQDKLEDEQFQEELEQFLEDKNRGELVA
jgi:hypothetical protein